MVGTVRCVEGTGGAAVKASLGGRGLTTAKDTAPDVWPAIIAAMREAM